MLVINNSSHL